MDVAELRRVRWEEMLPHVFRDALAACPVCYLPYGLAEPHGPYNALGLDFIKARMLVEEAAAAHGGIVAPPVAWHIQERPEFDWLGSNGVGQNYCSSLSPELFYKLVLSQLRAVDARGFHGAILVTGHYGGVERDLRLLCDFYTHTTGSPLQLYACADWELNTVEGYGGDHAGIVETSQLMALRPDLVELERTVEDVDFGAFCGRPFPNGKGESPSAELGRRLIDSQVASLGERSRTLLTDWAGDDDWHAPSLTDVNVLWTRFEKLTRRYWVCSMTYDEYMERKQWPAFPGWAALGEG
jgi:creatinine amidohydrolase